MDYFVYTNWLSVENILKTDRKSKKILLFQCTKWNRNQMKLVRLYSNKFSLDLSVFASIYQSKSPQEYFKNLENCKIICLLSFNFASISNIIDNN